MSTNAPRARRLVLAALALSIAVPALAADAVYRTPPAPIGAILDAPRLPRGAPALSPDGARMVVPVLPSLIPIASLAEPVEKLAGLEILPQLRANRVAIKQAPTGLRVVTLANAASVNATLPEGARVVSIKWSNDAKRLAVAVLAPGGADVWIVDAATGASRALPGVKLNAVLGVRLEWSNDDASLFCGLVPAGLALPAPGSRVPAGPQTRASAGRAAGQRTARDVLRTADDQARFANFLSTQVARVDAATGAVTRLGAPVLLSSLAIAPDEAHLLVERYDDAVPLGFPFYLFPSRTEVWDAKGALVATVGTSPLNERSAISSVPALGARDAQWAPDGASVWYFQWQDTPGADPVKAVRDTSLPPPGTDRLMRLDAPFTGAAEAVCTSDWPIGGFGWIGTTGRLMLQAEYAPRRIERRWWIDPARKGEAHELVRRSTEGVYDDPGQPLEKPWRHTSVAWTTPDGKALWQVAPGFRADGQRPFLARVDLASGRSVRVFESDAAHLETPLALLDPAAARFVTSRESGREPRNYWLRSAGKAAAVRLTSNVDPAPALTASKRISFTFTRPDSVKLNAEAVLPADWSPSRPLPTVFWIYPNDYRSAAAASQNRRSPNRFPSQSTLNPEVLVTQGYCVVYPDIAVVGTNDHYVEQIRMSAQAAVDECVRRGFTDRARVGVAGHSYGAFSTANLLAHTDLFKAGVASDGAYNRTLTPFTFQAEERNLWQAPDTYLAMSPFVHADQIHAPLLLMHNLDDTNVGTNPIQSDRMYEALSGLGRTVSLVQYPYEDHVPVARESVLDYWTRALEWFDTWVKNAGGPAGPAKPAP